MNKQVIETPAAPAPIGPYSQAITIGKMIFVSGQIAIDPSTGNLIKGEIKTETNQVMENIKAILASGGADFSQVVKTTIYLADMNQFSAVNEIYGYYFSGNFPARETVQVAALPMKANVEISMIAHL
ncbi:MAG: RidA family protein [Chitinophagales bacterium]|nr:RidA family protein [Chitinophagales bacterium]